MVVAALLPCELPAHAQVEPPALTRRADGLWDASRPPAGTLLRYTLDGNEPTRDSGAWLAPVDVPPGYVLKVRAFNTDGTLLPRGERPNPARDAVGEVNRRLATLEGRHGITYLDVGSAFLTVNGTISMEVMYDFLHPTAKGYDLWAAAMTGALDRLLQSQATPARD